MKAQQSLVCLVLIFSNLLLSGNQVPLTLWQKLQKPITSIKNRYANLTPQVRRTCAVVGVMALPFIKPVILSGYEFLVNYHFDKQKKRYVILDKIKPLKSSMKLGDLKRTIPSMILKVKNHCSQKPWFPAITNYWYPYSQKTLCKNLLIYHQSSDEELIELMYALGGEITVFELHSLINYNLNQKEPSIIRNQLAEIFEIIQYYGKPVVWFSDCQGSEEKAYILENLFIFLKENPGYETITTIVTTNRAPKLKQKGFGIKEEYKKPTPEERKAIIDARFAEYGLSRTSECDNLLYEKELSQREFKFFLSLCRYEASESNVTIITDSMAQSVLDKINNDTENNRASLFNFKNPNNVPLTQE